MASVRPVNRMAYQEPFSISDIEPSMRSPLTQLYDNLRDANLARQEVWAGGDAIDLSFRGLELAGEVGELLNKVKKLIRFYKGIQGNKPSTVAADIELDLKKAIAEELGDVVICADLLAMDMDIDLRSALVAKFNATSAKHNMRVKLLVGAL